MSLQVAVPDRGGENCIIVYSEASFSFPVIVAGFFKGVVTQMSKWRCRGFSEVGCHKRHLFPLRSMRHSGDFHHITVDRSPAWAENPNLGGGS